MTVTLCNGVCGPYLFIFSLAFTFSITTLMTVAFTFTAAVVITRFGAEPICFALAMADAVTISAALAGELGDGIPIGLVKFIGFAGVFRLTKPIRLFPVAITNRARMNIIVLEHIAPT